MNRKVEIRKILLSTKIAFTFYFYVTFMNDNKNRLVSLLGY